MTGVDCGAPRAGERTEGPGSSVNRSTLRSTVPGELARFWAGATATVTADIHAAIKAAAATGDFIGERRDYKVTPTPEVCPPNRSDATLNLNQSRNRLRGRAG